MPGEDAAQGSGLAAADALGGWSEEAGLAGVSAVTGSVLSVVTGPAVNVVDGDGVSFLAEHKEQSVAPRVTRAAPLGLLHPCPPLPWGLRTFLSTTDQPPWPSPASF